MSDVHPLVFEQAIGNLLTAAGFAVERPPKGAQPFGFVFTDSQGRRNAVRMSVEPLSIPELTETARGLAKAGAGIDRFLLVTPEKPGGNERMEFNDALKGAPVLTDWLSGNELTSFFGLGEELDLSAPETLDGLQMAAITSNMEKYLELPQADRSDLSRVIRSARKRIGEVPREYNNLRRQFSFATIKRLTRNHEPLDQQLLIGARVEDVTVVMSDLKNFSALVTAAGGEQLKRVMSRYYRRSRELVWKHGGVLDKFIGDAVLAIFNYPYMSPLAPVRAMAFARDLIALGNDSLGELVQQLPGKVDIGTRVGICSGEIWVLDIGQEDIEVAFFGDTINLAARLEANCAVDAMLMDPRTWSCIEAEDPGLVELIRPKSRHLPAGLLKGQRHPVRAWQVSYAAIGAVEMIAGPGDG